MRFPFGYRPLLNCVGSDGLTGSGANTICEAAAGEMPSPLKYEVICAEEKQL